jgi:hypothetical protein
MESNIETMIPPFPACIESSCDFAQALMKVQRAAQRITSTLELDHVLDRVVNDLSSPSAASKSTSGCVSLAPTTSSSAASRAAVSTAKATA